MVVRLGDVCRVQNGYAFDGQRFSDVAGTPLVRIRDLKTNRPSLRYDGPFDPEYIVRGGDVLVGMDGEFRPYQWAGPEALLNQRVCRLVPDESVLDGNYLFLAIGKYLGEIERTTGQTTVKHLSSRTINEIRLPLPELVDQRRLANRLTEKLDAAHDALERAHDQLLVIRQIRARARNEAFQGVVPLSGGRTETPAPPGWQWHLLTDLARLESGHTPSRSRPDWWGGDVPWIALPDIRAVDGEVIEDTIEQTNAEGIAHSAARILPTDTIVMSRTASVGFVARMGRPMATSQDFVDWVCGPDLDPEFLMHLLIRSRDYVRGLSSGAIHKTVYFPTVKAFRVCVPPIRDQRRIATELRQQVVRIDAIASAAAAELAAIRALPNALVKQAFAEVHS